MARLVRPAASSVTAAENGDDQAVNPERMEKLFLSLA
jgi:hypothetical protein